MVTAVLGMVSEKGRERKREKEILGFLGFVGCLVTDNTLYPHVYSFLW